MIIERLVGDLNTILETFDLQREYASPKEQAEMLKQALLLEDIKAGADRHDTLFDQREKAEDEILQNPKADLVQRISVLAARAKRELELYDDIKRLNSQLQRRPSRQTLPGERGKGPVGCRLSLASGTSDAKRLGARWWRPHGRKS